jgi:hypothetical protein
MSASPLHHASPRCRLCPCLDQVSHRGGARLQQRGTTGPGSAAGSGDVQPRPARGAQRSKATECGVGPARRLASDTRGGGELEGGGPRALLRVDQRSYDGSSLTPPLDKAKRR